MAHDEPSWAASKVIHDDEFQCYRCFEVFKISVVSKIVRDSFVELFCPICIVPETVIEAKKLNS
jgi:hypothetical protein